MKKKYIYGASHFVTPVVMGGKYAHIELYTDNDGDGEDGFYIEAQLQHEQQENLQEQQQENEQVQQENLQEQQENLQQQQENLQQQQEQLQEICKSF